MRSKFLKVVIALVLPIAIASQANASLILGDIVEDAAGAEWAYVGLFNLTDGPFWNDANDCFNSQDPNCVDQFADALNGIQAAEKLFGTLTEGVYATSTEFTIVDHLAWYDAFQSNSRTVSESIAADAGGDGIYSSIGDMSAYIQDRSFFNGIVGQVNYVFRSISVPEPSSLAVFALAIFGLGARRLKQQSI